MEKTFFFFILFIISEHSVMLTPPQNCSYMVAFRSHFIGKPSFKKNKVTADNVLTKNLFVIKLKRKIGITGETGSGKSTFIDILMGLLTPTNGKVFIDGKELSNENLRSWQSKISHVPQNIYLSKQFFS